MTEWDSPGAAYAVETGDAEHFRGLEMENDGEGGGLPLLETGPADAMGCIPVHFRDPDEYHRDYLIARAKAHGFASVEDMAEAEREAAAVAEERDRQVVSEIKASSFEEWSKLRDAQERARVRVWDRLAGRRP